MLFGFIETGKGDKLMNMSEESQEVIEMLVSFGIICIE
jgi:hypothetical protein